MEDYTQITLDDWVRLKESLKRDLIGVQESFVRIGYTLRKIEEEKLYEKDGYKNVTEFAKAEYGLNPSTVSRFISINRKYSVNGYSDQLRPEFMQMGSSKLSEMLSLPDQDLEMIKPEATRESIRELKQFNREAQEDGTADDIRSLIRMFFKDNAGDLESLRTSEAYSTGKVDKLVEILNPSGTRTYRKGLYFLMMYEQEIKIKKFKGSPQSMSWEEFFSVAKEIIEDTQVVNLEDMEEKCVCETVEEADCEEGAEDVVAESKEDSVVAADSDGNNGIVEEDNIEEKPQESEDEVDQEKKDPKEEIAPAQDSVEEDIVEPEERTIKECGPEPREDVDGQAERIPERYKTRKEYLDSLSIYRMAHYMNEEYDRRSLQSSMLCYPSQIIDWLTQEVDNQGREIVDV